MVRIVHNNKGYRALLRHPRLVEDLASRAGRIAESSGPGYQAETNSPTKRARSVVIAGRTDAARDNSANNTLIRNLDQGK